ncbi:MAG: hypothetical protein ACN4GR_17065 [Arenicellales bacterium]
MDVKMDVSEHDRRISDLKMVLILSVAAWAVMITGIYLMFKIIT